MATLPGAWPYRAIAETGWLGVSIQVATLPGAWPYRAIAETGWLGVSIQVATLPGAWPYRAIAETGWLGVSILLLGEKEILSATSVSVWQQLQMSEQIRP